MFCSNCGNDMGDGKFCPNCGTQAGASANQQPENTEPNKNYEEIILWEGKPSGLMAKAKEKVHDDLNDTSYKITNQRIIINSGLIGKKETEIDMKHIKDIKVKQSLTQRATGVGDIIVMSTDVSDGTFEIKSVANAVEVKEIIRKALMDYRSNMNIVYKEDI